MLHCKFAKTAFLLSSQQILMLKTPSKKSLIFSALTVFFAQIHIAPATAQQASSINVSGKDTVTFVVSNLAAAAGFGAHFSTANEDGYGGTDAECHLTSGTAQSPASTVTLLCYDGYKDAQNVQNEFRLDLGQKQINGQLVLSHITITVSRRAVDVDVVRIATNPYTKERKPYTVSTSFPIREESGFFKTGTILYKANGVLANTPGREGSGYVLNTPLTNPIAR